MYVGPRSVCLSVCQPACLSVCLSLRRYVCLSVCMYVFMYVYVHVYACMYACMYVCMYGSPLLTFSSQPSCLVAQLSQSSSFRSVCGEFLLLNFCNFWSLCSKHCFGMLSCSAFYAFLHVSMRCFDLVGRVIFVRTF